MKSYEWLATAAFGLEGVVARELTGLALPEVRAENGGARFTGEPSDAFRANLWLRCADRVLLVVGRFPATSFDMLFEGVRKMPWEQYLPRDATFPVRGKCARSQLKSVSDCQAIVKKAIATRLAQHYGIERLPETGATYQVDVSLHGDVAQLTLDSSGTALNRRGYRTWNGEAPLRETLAAALVELSPWRPGQPLYDPMCGTGTLLVEAALQMGRVAPGLRRDFACEAWHFFPREETRTLRQEAEAKANPDAVSGIAGSDIDPEALALAQKHMQQAGLDTRIPLRQADVAGLSVPGEGGTFLCNPPYGERLKKGEDLSPLYRSLKDLTLRHPTWRLCLLTGDPGFERAFGRRADRRRRLYNGRLECELLTYFPAAADAAARIKI